MNRAPVVLIAVAGLGLAAWQGVAALQAAEQPAPETAAPVPVRRAADTPDAAPAPKPAPTDPV